ncbi:nuclear transport factor 2 family protein [Tomitella biformata]|uniref:nuclear transport factor 2 family protein n=1 Tax=Tomitella biformata TaxID=630403 RepID=UPI0004AE2AC7|nr:nuclear transport factor 2 family protein [Tomitella biformata]
MTMTLQHLSDRLEIQDLLVEYCHCVDSMDWDGLDDVFTVDAHIDYTAMGGSSGDLAHTKEFLAAALPNFAGFQHMISTSKITIAGDTATGKTICHNPMIATGDAGQPLVMHCGFWYVDAFVRTAAGWRIHTRREERSYSPTLLGS